MKHWIVWLHRYLGIPLSLVFVVWFLSGIVMMYTGDMPALSTEARLGGLGAVELAAVSVAPDEAARRAGLDGEITTARLQTLLGRPAWRLGRIFGAPATVFADTGERFTAATREDGAAEVARFLGRPRSAVRHVETVIEADQWTITQIRELPLERYDVDDGQATRAYFSLGRGEVVLVTDRKSRALAWLGAIPHWFYFTPLRVNQPVWYWTVVWVSAAGCLLAVLGLVLAVTQFRRSKPFRLSASIRYRGLMRWHYYTGAIFGVFSLSWVFSGLLSMEPFDWTNAPIVDLPLNTLEGGALELGRYRLRDPAFVAALDGEAPLEIELKRLQTEPYFVVATAAAGGPARRVIHAETLAPRSAPFAAETILRELEATATELPIAAFAVLDRYDAYYYARDAAAPLPVLRVEFADEARTWYYFDLMTSSPVLAMHRLARLERWLFNGLHSLDFGFWYDRRPLWDIGLILLSAGGLATSAIGLVLGYRRLFGRKSRAERALPG